MLKNREKTQPRFRQTQKMAGGLEVSFLCHNTLCRLHLLATHLLSAPDLCRSRKVLLMAPRGLRIPIDLWGRREAVLKEPRQTVAGNFSLMDNYTADFVAGKTLDEVLVIHCHNGLPQPGSCLYILLCIYQHWVEFGLKTYSQWHMSKYNTETGYP